MENKGLDLNTRVELLCLELETIARILSNLHDRLVALENDEQA